MEKLKGFIKKYPAIIVLAIAVIIVITMLVMKSMNNNIKETMTYSELITSIEDAKVDSIELSANSKEAYVILKGDTTEKKVAIPSVDSFIDFINEELTSGNMIKFEQKK